MQYNSIEFIFSFLPIFLLLYFSVRNELRRPILILGSLIFYALSSGGNYWWIALLLAVTVQAYFVSRHMKGQGSGIVLVLSLIFLAGILTFFKLFRAGKYLPAGMSFYFFQIAAYYIDVYRGRITPERELSLFLEQIVMFPKLLSGPLMDPRQLKIQSRTCKLSAKNVKLGLQRFILGLGLKVLIANRIGGLWGQAAVIGYNSISTPFAWLALVAYAMKLYFDFYGYSLMAMGIGKMLGYDLPENFIHPYISKTVSEFYRRWHVTLGAWFREYLYFPLGGSRKGTLRTILNLAVVWLFTGLWHGIGGNYLLWAGFLLVLIINERLWLGKILNKVSILGHFYTVFVILLSWLPFAIGDWGQMITYAGRLFGMCGSSANSLDFVIWGQEYIGLMVAGVFCATPLPQKLWKSIHNSILGDVLLLVLFWVVVYFISTAAQDPFMYFQY